MGAPTRYDDGLDRAEHDVDTEDPEFVEWCRDNGYELPAEEDDAVAAYEEQLEEWRREDYAEWRAEQRAEARAQRAEARAERWL